MCRSQGYTEREIAGYMRQLLLGLRHMHDNNIAHLGLTVSILQKNKNKIQYNLYWLRSRSS